MFYGGNFPLGTGLTPLHLFNPGVLELQTEEASVGRSLNASVERSRVSSAKSGQDNACASKWHILANALEQAPQL